MKRSTQRMMIWAGVSVALLLVFLAYLDPHLAVDLANAVWACF